MHRYTLRLGALLSFLAPAALAAGPEAFLAPEPGASACWVRVYDAEHLAAHPEQRVREMRFGLSYDAEQTAAPYSFALWADVRGEAGPGVAAGPCIEGEGGMSCGVECDGGGVLVRMTDTPGRIHIDLARTGYIRMTTDCGSEEGFPLTPGADDAHFLLDAADAALCGGLVPARKADPID